MPRIAPTKVMKVDVVDLSGCLSYTLWSQIILVVLPCAPVRLGIIDPFPGHMHTVLGIIVLGII